MRVSYWYSYTHSLTSWSIQFSSVAQSCLTFCIPGFPVHHQLPELTQTHVNRVSDAIQPPHPLLSPSPAFSLFQHPGLFKWVSSSHQVAKILGISASASVLSMNIQDWFSLGCMKRCHCIWTVLPRGHFNLHKWFQEGLKWKWKSLSHVQLFVTPEYWSGSLSLFQGIFPTQGLNPGLPHWRRILYQLSHQGSPRILEWVAYPFSSGSSRPRNWTESPALQVDSLPTELSGKPSRGTRGGAIKTWRLTQDP